MSTPQALLSILKRRFLPAASTFTSVVFAALIYLALTPRLYETTARLMINNRQISVSDLGRDLATLPENVAGGVNPLATQAELMKSRQVLERAAKKIAASYGGEAPTASQLREELSIKIIPATSILELSYQHENPETAAILLNAITSSVVEQNVENIRAGARSVREFLEAEVPKQKELLEKAEEAENLYRQVNGLVSVEDQTRELVQSLAAINNQERELGSRQQAVLAQNTSLKQLVDETSLQDAYTSARIGQDEELRDLRSRLNELEAQVIEVQSRLGDQHPDLLALLEQRNELHQLYEDKLSRILPTEQSSGDIAGDALSQELITQLITSDIEKVALERQILAIENDRQELEVRLRELPIRQQVLSNLVRNREEAEAALEQLQAQLREAKIAEAQLVSNVQILSRADTPIDPSSPNKPSVLVASAVFGVILAIGSVLLLEVLDNSLYDVSEAEKLFERPSLGSLPILPSHSLVLEEPEYFLNDARLVEPYRKLLKTLEFRGRNSLRLLVISSALTGEGKSTVASHLAMVASMFSKRTLLIDADLYSPKQQDLFNLSPTPGLTDVIDGQKSLSEAIQRTKNENLHVLTCGKYSQCPSMLMESASTKKLIKEAAEKFDFIILDTPAINSYADALALSPYSDGLLLVVHPGLTTRNGLSQTIEELNKSGTYLIGFVANKITNQISSRYFDVKNKQKLLPLAPNTSTEMEYCNDENPLLGELSHDKG